MIISVSCLSHYYKGCPESNISYLFMLDHDIRGRYWWDAAEVEPSYQYSITLCCCMTDGSREVLQTGWCLTWKCIESKGVSLNSFMWEKKWHSLTFINTCSNVYGDQTVDVSTVRWWVVCFSSGDSGSPALVQVFTNRACRFLFVAGESA